MYPGIWHPHPPTSVQQSHTNNVLLFPSSLLDWRVDLVRERANDIPTRPVFADEVPPSRPTQATPAPDGGGVLPDQLGKVARLLAEARSAEVVFVKFLSPFFLLTQLPISLWEQSVSKEKTEEKKEEKKEKRSRTKINTIRHRRTPQRDVLPVRPPRVRPLALGPVARRGGGVPHRREIRRGKVGDGVVPRDPASVEAVAEKVGAVEDGRGEERGFGKLRRGRGHGRRDRYAHGHGRVGRWRWVIGDGDGGHGQAGEGKAEEVHQENWLSRQCGGIVRLVCRVVFGTGQEENGR